VRSDVERIDCEGTSGKKKERGARRNQPAHRRLFYCVKINRTSLDHLLLGKSADVDRITQQAETVAWFNYSAAIFLFNMAVSVYKRASRRPPNGQGNK
jgi:hypothetical protein